jgi:hypothetical protein
MDGEKMISSKMCLAVAAFLALTGCDSLQQQPRSAAPPPKLHYQRFLPIAPESVMTEGVPWHGYFALDTKTGTLCSAIKGRVFKGASEWANDVPSCENVLTTNPD